MYIIAVAYKEANECPKSEVTLQESGHIGFSVLFLKACVTYYW